MATRVYEPDWAALTFVVPTFRKGRERWGTLGVMVRATKHLDKVDVFSARF